MDGVTFLEREYPTIYDYDESAYLEGKTVVDEIKGESTLVRDAAVGTTSGFKFDVDRLVEKKYTAEPAAFDEGYTAHTDGRAETISFNTMRVSDARTFDQLVRGSVPGGKEARYTMAIQKMSQSLVKEKARNLLYGGMAASDGTINAKEIRGLMHYLDTISDEQKMRTRWEGGVLSPFDSEKGFTINNQDGNEYGSPATGAAGNFDLSGESKKALWTSIVAIGWGKDGVFTTFPTAVDGAGAGYMLTPHMDNQNPYVDKMTEKKKMTWDDWLTGDAYFGLGIKNRFCISGIRNIYLGHKTKKLREDEMYRVRQNLIRLDRFHNMGETGVPMLYYCSPFLLAEMEGFMKNIVTMVGNTPDQNDGSYGKIEYNRLRIADNIYLTADKALLTSEKWIGAPVE